MRELELVLIDDGSTDGSESVCREFSLKDDRIRYFRFSNNSGTPARRYNDGIFLSKTDLLMFMFDDDVLLDNAVEDLYQAITVTYPNSMMVYGQAEYVDVRNGSYISKNFGDPWNKKKIEHNNFLCNNSVIVRKKAINEVGGYDEDPLFKRLCDWDLWYRIGMKYEVSRLEKNVSRCFAHNNDSIGVTVTLQGGDISKIRMIQKENTRKIRLQNNLLRKPKFTFVHAGHDAALRRWNIDYLINSLKDEGFETACISEAEAISDFGNLNSEFFVFYRNWSSTALKMMIDLRKKGSYIFYSIDDYVFQEGCVYFSQDKTQIKMMIENCDCVITTTDELKKKLPLNKNTIVRINSVDEETFNILGKNEHQENDVFNIGWLSGIDRHEMDDFVKRILIKLDETGEKFKFSCFGLHDFRDFKNITVCQNGYVAPTDWRRLYEFYADSNFDVIINPLKENDEFFKCKSGVKLVESSSMGVPLIVSKISPFNDLIKEGVTGFFASSEEDFVKNVLFIKNNKEETNKMRTRIKERAKTDFNIKYVCRDFLTKVISLNHKIIINKAPDINRLNERDKLSMYVLKVCNSVGQNCFLEQSMRLNKDINIKTISVYGATFCRRPTGSLALNIRFNGNCIKESRVEKEELYDNAWWQFKLNETVELKSGNSIIIKIKNEGTLPVAFYLCEDPRIGRANVNGFQIQPITMMFSEQE
jgi:glycosyltransferase involved in cell wall biosynthesis